MSFRRWIFLLGALSALLCAQPVRADNGPHGGYTATTDACAGCHRAHTAQGNNLLVTGSSTALCLTCHGTTGTGADTDVMDGVYLQRDTTTESPDEGEVNRGLKAGGFLYARMDTAWVGSTAARPVTSSHLWDASTGTAWGSGTWGSGPGEAMALECVSCHDPHGGAGGGNAATYRLLRPTPLGSGTSAVMIADENPKHYTIDAADGKYFGQTYEAVTFNNLAAWCATCHDRYLATAGSGHTYSGDDVFAYRHISVGSGCGCHNMNGGPPPTGNTTYAHQPVSCLTCHVAHGSSASMGGYAAHVAWPDGSTAPSGDARSALLRVDNRGTCELCHNK